MFTKRLYALILILPFLINSPILIKGEPVLAQEQQIGTRQMDKRAQILKAYLAKYNSPLENQAQDFIDAADTYNLDWKFVAAIAGNESTFGKFVPGGHQPGYSSYNAWGWGVYGTQAIYFKSWRDGIFTVSKGLRENYFNRGLTDPYAINRVYAASPHWGKNVTFFLQDMEKFQKEYAGKEALEITSSFVPQTAGSSAIILASAN